MQLGISEGYPVKVSHFPYGTEVHLSHLVRLVYVKRERDWIDIDENGNKRITKLYTMTSEGSTEEILNRTPGRESTKFWTDVNALVDKAVDVFFTGNF